MVIYFFPFTVIYFFPFIMFFLNISNSSEFKCQCNNHIPYPSSLPQKKQSNLSKFYVAWRSCSVAEGYDCSVNTNTYVCFSTCHQLWSIHRFSREWKLKASWNCWQRSFFSLGSHSQMDSLISEDMEQHFTATGAQL